MKYYLRGDYYFDIDDYNQLRIAGPQNHLLLGMAFPHDVHLEVISTEMHGKDLAILLKASAKDLTLTLPLVTDIRTLRSHVEPITPKPLYSSLVDQKIDDLLPDSITPMTMYGRHYLLCKNSYTDESGQIQQFGAYIGVGDESTITVQDSYFLLSTTSDALNIWVQTYSSVTPQPFTLTIYRPRDPIGEGLLPEDVLAIYQHASEEVEYLLRTRKTSGFEYGTIFPRDWIESADLGRYDLTKDTIEFMYEESMRNISEAGEGWHEDLVGFYKAKTADATMHVDRKMIDIEPKYILGLRHLRTSFLTRPEIHDKLRLVASYILKNAEEHDVITFKKVNPDSDTYHFVGNWRDSYHAYPRQKAPLAPYDVNCVLYPRALELIKEHHAYFGIDEKIVDPLIKKWSGQKDKFRLYHPGGIVGYSLALHGIKRTPLPISHLDEAYDLFYSHPSMEETVSFAKKVLNPEFFNTPVGPTLVAADEEDFSTREYHGKVIWPKQSAFAMAGLTKQFKRAIVENWPGHISDLIRSAALSIANTSFRAFVELNSTPELYYYDSQEEKARLYTDQPGYEAQMSIVQLWSSIGARRMVHDYLFLQQ